jgi:hypothetical protein
LLFLRKLKYGLLLGGGFWVIWTWLPWWQALKQPPDAIVVIGGGIHREIAAAQLAQTHSTLPVVVSSGSTLPCLYRVFVEKHEVSWRRVTADFRATDTVTNFTAVLTYLHSKTPRKVFVVASEGHWSRVSVLGWIIWGSRGIAMQPVLPIEGGGHDESWFKTLRDSLRAVAWIVLGEIAVANFYHSDTYINTQRNLRQSHCEIVGNAIMPDERDEGRGAAAKRSRHKPFFLPLAPRP